MAYDFTASTSEYIVFDQSAIPNADCTVTQWVNFIDTSGVVLWSDQSNNNLVRTDLSSNLLVEVDGNTVNLSIGFSADKWYYVAVVVDGSNVTGYAYDFSAASLASDSASESSHWNMGNDGHIGRRTSFTFEGSIGYFRVWDRALTQLEVEESVFNFWTRPEALTLGCPLFGESTTEPSYGKTVSSVSVNGSLSVNYTIPMVSFFRSSMVLVSSSVTEFAQTVTGSLSFSGFSLKKISLFPSGVLSMSAVVVFKFFTVLLGTLSFTGTLTSLRTVFSVLSGTLSFSSGVVSWVLSQVRERERKLINVSNVETIDEGEG